ncbi:MAG: hypothetical protein JXR77_15880, partial [Lentisphaeria bacterium]|nr:hypothetical protein [Lentisphaeria bacterium]
MTIRALFIGLLLGALIAAFGYANDWVCRLPYVASDLMPVSVYGIVLLGLIGLNPLLRALRLRRLGGPEWAVICALALTACVIPGPGLLWQFHNALIMPHHMARVNPGWQATAERQAVLDYVPPAMLVDPEQGDAAGEGIVVNGFLQGLAEGDDRLPWSRVPWRAWLRPYLFYVPLILLLAVATVSLALILHVQWSRHEHLAYPMAAFAGALLGDDPRDPFRTCRSNRPFWLGFAFSFGILLLNGCYTWWPETMIQVPQYVDLRPLASLMGWIKNVPGGLDALYPRFFFAVVGLAFLINAEVSFSVGVSMAAYALVFGILAGLGISANNEYLAGGTLGFQLFGAYVGAALFLVYTGRHFYLHVLRSALGLTPPPEEARHTAGAARVLLLSTVAAVALLHLALRVDLLVGAGLVALFGLLFVVVTRINAETGLLFVQPTWQPVAILLAVFGARALGPVPLVVAGILCVVLSIDPRVCLMPLVANALKLAEGQRLRLPTLSAWMLAAFSLCLLIALPVTLYIQYAAGGGVLYGWANTATQMPFDLLVRELHRLAALGTFDAATGQVRFGLGRLLHAAPNSTFLWAAGAGVATVVGCNAARLRWKRWPIHPVMFMVWG